MRHFPAFNSVYRKNIEKRFDCLNIEIGNLFFLPVTTPVESCCWAWSKLDPDSASTTPYLNENGFGGPLNGSLELMAGLAVVRLILIERSKIYNIITIGFSDYIIILTLYTLFGILRLGSELPNTPSKS